MGKVLITLGGVAVACFFFVLGVLANAQSWRQDCDKLGKHLTNGGRVYVCYLEEKKWSSN